MKDSHPEKSQHAGRRARRYGDDVVPEEPSRRGSVGASSVRGALGNSKQDTSDADNRWWLQPGWWAVAAALVVLLTLTFSLVLSPSSVTSTPQQAVPVSTSGNTPTQADVSTAATQSVRPDLASSPGSSTSVSPQDSAPPLPQDTPSSPDLPAPSDPILDGSALAEPPPTTTQTAGNIQLDDAAFLAPEGWRLYGDEQIENSRRVVRLSQPATDVRLQAATLEPSGEPLQSSCSALVDFQQAQFADVTHQLVSPISVDPGLGSAVQCGFNGVRESDGVPNTVSFTLVTRANDSHVLMLRTTVPEQSVDSSTVVAQLSAMTCGASTSFGVPLPLC